MCNTLFTSVLRRSLIVCTACTPSSDSLNADAKSNHLAFHLDINCLHTVMRIIKLKIFPVPVRLHSGYDKLIFVFISPFFAISKNAVHSVEPGETPSYSASHQAPNYAQRS